MRRLWKVCAVTFSTLALAAGATNTSQAGIIPWMYNAIFGPVGSMGYGAYYAPAPVPVGVGYAPVWGGGGCGTCTAGYAPYSVAYAPFDVGCCSPCGSACSPCDSGSSPCGPGGCPGGDCGVNLGAPPMNPIPYGDPPPPQPGPPSTYGPNPGGPNPGGPNPDNPTTGNPNYDQDGFRSRSSNPPPPANNAPMGSPQETMRPETTILPRNPAPVPDINDDTTTSPSTLRFPTLNLDSKITWRPTAERTRLTIHAHFTKPTVTRVPTKPNADWAAVPATTKVAKN